MVVFPRILIEPFHLTYLGMDGCVLPLLTSVFVVNLTRDVMIWHVIRAFLDQMETDGLFMHSFHVYVRIL